MIRREFEEDGSWRGGGSAQNERVSVFITRRTLDLKEGTFRAKVGIQIKLKNAESHQG